MRINKKFTGILILLLLLLIVVFYPSPYLLPNRYRQRSSGDIKTEKVMGEKWLQWLYSNPVGEATMFTLVKRRFVSSLYGHMMDAPASVKKIKPFVKEFNINMDIAQSKEFTSFNDFFTRKLKKSARPIDTGLNVVVSPADGKILAYADINNTDFIIKNSRFNVASFLSDTNIAKRYTDGSLIVIRLAPYDYHRFHFPVTGKISQLTKIDGDLYSVNPIALRHMVEIFFQNKREYVSIATQNFGEIIMAEIGATMVGSIIQTYKGNEATKGEEKGYFKFGGSTVVLIFEKGKVIIDDDLLANTSAELETEIKMGERIGQSY